MKFSLLGMMVVFNRGRTGQDPDGVVALRGDRTNGDDLRRLAEAGPWDAVVNREAVEAAAHVLGPVTGRYVYTSTVSVYAGWPLLPPSEELPTLADVPPADGMPSDVNVPYGVDKARCEPRGWQPVGAGPCASCAASAARPPRGGVRPEACDGSRRRGGREPGRVTGAPGPVRRCDRVSAKK